jgi:acetyltransferase-like isoleucine patch superfamily enzyme
LGNNISIAHNSSILSSTHNYHNIDIPIKYNEMTLLPTFIKDDVWIGCGCRILGGVTINTRSIIAAGAVINRDCDGSSIYGGVPGKKLKQI